MRRLAILFITFSLIITGLTACTKPEPPLTTIELLSLGEKYLLELNYEQALVQFTKVIEIEPMNPCGYTGAAESYAALGQHEEAKKILQQGYEVVGSSEIKELLEVSISEIEGSPPEAQEAQTADEESGQNVAEFEEQTEANTATEEPQLPQPRAGYPKTERRERVRSDELAVEYAIEEYNEYGNLGKWVCYSINNVELYSYEMTYDTHQNRIQATYINLNNESNRIAKAETFYDLSARVIKKERWFKSGRNEIEIYNYVDENMVIITLLGNVYEEEGRVFSGYEQTIMHKMTSEDSRVAVSGGSGSYETGGYTSITIIEEHSYGEQNTAKEYTYTPQ